MSKKKPLIIAILIFIILAICYEYYIYSWSKNEMGPIIRVDIFIIYPALIVLSIIVYWLSKKLLK